MNSLQYYPFYDPTFAVTVFWQWFTRAAVLAAVVLLVVIAIDLWRDK